MDEIDHTDVLRSSPPDMQSLTAKWEFVVELLHEHHALMMAFQKSRRKIYWLRHEAAAANEGQEACKMMLERFYECLKTHKKTICDLKKKNTILEDSVAAGRNSVNVLEAKNLHLEKIVAQNEMDIKKLEKEKQAFVEELATLQEDEVSKQPLLVKNKHVQTRCAKPEDILTNKHETKEKEICSRKQMRDIIQQVIATKEHIRKLSSQTQDDCLVISSNIKSIRANIQGQKTKLDYAISSI